jgi:hypothetical protein
MAWLRTPAIFLISVFAHAFLLSLYYWGNGAATEHGILTRRDDISPADGTNNMKACSAVSTASSPVLSAHTVPLSTESQSMKSPFVSAKTSLASWTNSSSPSLSSGQNKGGTPSSPTKASATNVITAAALNSATMGTSAATDNVATTITALPAGATLLTLSPNAFTSPVYITTTSPGGSSPTVVPGMTPASHIYRWSLHRRLSIHVCFKS